MADVYDVTVTVRKNGQKMPGYDTLTRRLLVDESQSFDYEKTTGGGYATLPVTSLDEINILILRATDQSVTIRLDAQSDAGIIIQPGGLVVLFDVDIDAGASTNATVENSSGSTTVINGLVGGT